MLKEIGFVLVTLLSYFRASQGLETIHAANFNGNIHTDSLGISYSVVSLQNSNSYSESYQNVPKADNSLYQTIAYGKSVKYSVPVNGSGHYLLIVKFVAWDAWSASFKMTLNDQHSVRSNFTWYDSSSKHDVAYDHYVYFSVCDDTLQYKNEESIIKNNTVEISIRNSDGYYTSMSAVAVLKGEVDQVPVLPTAELYSDVERWQVFDHVCYGEPTTTSTPPPGEDALKTVHAVNFNGNMHTDSLGISYESKKNGSSAKYSTTYKKVPSADQDLYRTITYGRQLSYSIPVNGSGKYLLLIKFVHWDSWSAVFKMTLNGQHTVRSNFTDTTARDIAYDHYVYFSVCEDMLQYKKETSEIRNGHIDIYVWSFSFITSMSALALLKGDVGALPVLPTAEIYLPSDMEDLSDHFCDSTTISTTTEGSTFETTTSEYSTSTEQTTSLEVTTSASTPLWNVTTTTTRPQTTTSTSRPPTSTSTTLRPSTTTSATPQPPTSPPPTPSKVVNIFNTFINYIVKNYNFNYIVDKRNRTVEIPAEVFN